MGPTKIQQLGVLLAAAVFVAAVGNNVVAATRDGPGKNYDLDHTLETVMSMLNCKSDSLIPSYICSVISKSRWGWASDDPNDHLTLDPPLPPLLNSTNLTKYVDELPQMPKILGYGFREGLPVPINLTIGMYNKTWQFHRDMPPTPVFVYGQSVDTATFPGPTIVARQNVPLFVTWENHLPDAHILPWDPTIDTAIANKTGVPTVVHLHGGAIPPESDGSAFAWFTADFREKGPAWTQTTYWYPNVQAPGNLWYHDHALGLTRENLLAGLLAAYVIEKPDLETPMNLPCDPHDLHLVIADRRFYSNGSIFMNSTGVAPSVHPQWQPEYFGEVITVNGKAWPFVNVQRRRYRLRILNASNARYLSITLSLSNSNGSAGIPFHVIGSDSSYLLKPVTVSNLVLSPAEIFDVIVDFSVLSPETEIEMLNSAPYPFPNGGNETDPQVDGKVMKFVVKALNGTLDNDMPDNSKVPEHGVSYASVTAVPPPTMTRIITLFEHFNNDSSNTTRKLDINYLNLTDPATEKPKSGTTELWQVINLTGDNHPLHLHLASFQAVKMQQLNDSETFTTCMNDKNNTVTCKLDKYLIGPELPVPEHEKAWKNVVKLPPAYMTTVLVAFRLVETNQPYPFDVTTKPGYVYHCHILDHEDNAMIRPLIMT
ncbi:hypothetical protein ABZP36_014828 [Zizania latifolia]